ncbi:MAG: ABC transporter permease [Duodenibacillus sp.]|nr:ABC transporter permease [Duodenibacillus sp.]
MSPKDFLRHTAALTLKEARQILRDPSVFILGVVMPLVMVLLFGYGMSFDIQNVRVAVVDDARTELSGQLAGAILANRTFAASPARSRAEGMRALGGFEVEALVVLEKRAGATVGQLVVDGIDAPRATMVSNAVQGAMNATLAARGQAAAPVAVVPRVWFNESLNSRWYLVPGLFVIVLTMTGMMLTSLVLAREWERGTMEAVIATPAAPLALLLSKALPYFAIGMAGWAACVGAALALYGIPVRGSFWVILGSSAVYLWMCLGLGLFISGATRSQFLSSQIALLVGFLPALILSGFIFDLRCVPPAASAFARCLPPVYYLELLKAGFLTGGMQELVERNMAILAGYALLFTLLALKQCAKRVR